MATLMQPLLFQLTKQCHFDGIKLVDDQTCNENSLRLKQFCQEKKLCMSQTFFDNSIDDRYTWYSSDGNTKKVIDYILVDQYMQQFIEECKVDTKADFQSDHRLVTSKMNTPTTKKARGKFAKTYTPKIKIDPKSLETPKKEPNLYMQSPMS